MALPSKNKNGVYQTRIVVPESLRDIVGVRELKQSLETRNEAEALALHIPVEAKFRQVIAKARLSLKTNERLTDEIMSDVLKGWCKSEATKASGKPKSYVYSGGISSEQVQFDDISDENSYIYDGVEDDSIIDDSESQHADSTYIFPNTDVIELVLDNLADLHRSALKLGKVSPKPYLIQYGRLHEILGGLVVPELAARQIEPTIRSTQYRKLLIQVAKTYIGISNAAVRRYQSELELVSYGAELQQFDISISDKTVLSLNELWDEYQSALHRRQPDSAGKRLRDYNSPIKKFLHFHGDADVTEITKRDVSEFRNVLERLPTRPKNAIASLPLLEQIKKASEQGLKTTSQNSVRTQMQAISALFSFAVDEAYIESNPVHGTTSNIPVQLHHDEDKSYRAGEIDKIFSSGIFHGDDKPKKANYGKAYYWLPLMLYYTGARAEELAQLYVSDVVLDSDVPHIKITDEQDDQSLKTGRRRQVPIHEHLIELGLPHYIAELPKIGRLFPQLTKPNGGKYHGKVSLWFGKYLKNELRIERAGLKPFHAFRHGFITSCRERGEREDVQNSVTGHTAQGVGATYGNYTLEVKNRLIQSIPRCFQ